MPNITEDVTESSSNNDDTKPNDEGAKANLKLDTSAPTTTVQIRLADGTRLAGQFNLTHTVADIQQYVQT